MTRTFIDSGELWDRLVCYLLLVETKKTCMIGQFGDTLKFGHALQSLSGPLGMFFMQITDGARKLSLKCAVFGGFLGGFVDDFKNLEFLKKSPFFDKIVKNEQKSM